VLLSGITQGANNIGVVGHGGCGNTSLTAGLLFTSARLAACPLRRTTAMDRRAPLSQRVLLESAARAEEACRIAGHSSDVSLPVECRPMGRRPGWPGFSASLQACSGAATAKEPPLRDFLIDYGIAPRPNPSSLRLDVGNSR
jgi:hypothetical protein